MNQHYYNDKWPTTNSPTLVKIGARVIYRGEDAADWLKRQKDRNVKATAKLFYA